MTRGYKSNNNRVKGSSRVKREIGREIIEKEAYRCEFIQSKCLYVCMCVMFQWIRE